jgi:hypothetical protein
MKIKTHLLQNYGVVTIKCIQFTTFKEDKNITQFILCPENSVLVTICEKERQITYIQKKFI